MVICKMKYVFPFSGEGVLTLGKKLQKAGASKGGAALQQVNIFLYIY